MRCKEKEGVLCVARYGYVWHMEGTYAFCSRLTSAGSSSLELLIGPGWAPKESKRVKRGEVGGIVRSFFLSPARLSQRTYSLQLLSHFAETTHHTSPAVPLSMFVWSFHSALIIFLCSPDLGAKLSRMSQ